MIDNLQRHYLQTLELAAEAALHDNVQFGIDTCLDLLLKTDLGFYTRACVNLMLADIAPISLHPDKSKYAAEALRIVNELQQEDNPDKNAFWTAEFARLKKDAESCLKRAQREEQEHSERLTIAAVGYIEEEMEDLALMQISVAHGGQRSVDDDDVQLRWVSVGAGDDIEVGAEPIGVEGAFSVNLPTAGPSVDDGDDGSGGGGSASSNMGTEERMEYEDMLGELPHMPAHKKKQTNIGKHGLPTPPPSSQ